jgi:pimeloyl-ACP methyl ester carboxylesterase
MQTILVPPLMCSASVYEPVMDTVWSRGAVTVADTRTDVTIASMAARLLRDAPERFALLGTSMGGYIALEVVRQAPDRVAGLALVSTSARADTPEQLTSRAQQSRLVEEGQFDRLIDAAFSTVVAPQHEGDLELLEAWRAMTRAVGAEAFLRQQRAVMDRLDAGALLPAVSCPTVVIHGADDRLIPLAMGQEIASAIPGAELVTIEDAGHFLFWEQPGAARVAVADFLDRVDVGR